MKSIDELFKEAEDTLEILDGKMLFDTIHVYEYDCADIRNKLQIALAKVKVAKFMYEKLLQYSYIASRCKSNNYKLFIRYLDIDTKVMMFLNKNKIIYLEQLGEFTYEDFSQIRGVGSKMLKAVIDCMNKYNISFIQYNGRE